MLKADYDLDSEEITLLLCWNLESSGRMIVGKAKWQQNMDYIRQILPVGRYQDSVIWKWDVIPSKENEALFCLFEEQVFTGAIYVENDGNWQVYDKEKNISKTDMSMVNCISHSNSFYIILK